MEGKSGKKVGLGKENKPNVWFSLRKSLHCKSEPSDVHQPKSKSKKHHQNESNSNSSSNNNNNNNINFLLTRKVLGRSGCSRSIANLRDVIHGSKRHIVKPPSCSPTPSPRSIGSSEFLNPIAHEVILSNSRCELKITGFAALHGGADGGGAGDGGGSKAFVGTLRPGTPGPGGYPTMHYFNNPSFVRTPSSSSFSRKSLSMEREGSPLFGSLNGVCGSRRRLPTEVGSNGGSNLSCHKCGEKFSSWDALETHHLSNHAVTELLEGDSSRKIVEIICKTGYQKPDNQSWRIERVLKVHNTQKTIARFEEHREMVKIKASKHPKKHPRCQADGNELLRFHGTTVACSLGLNGSSSLCISEKCCGCRIMRHGFFSKKEVRDGVGVFTTSTSGRAFESIKIDEVDGNDGCLRKVLIVCRVIAGRVHRPLENLQELAGQTGFDSVAGKVGLYSNIEELYLLNPRALLPCFVVICKP